MQVATFNLGLDRPDLLESCETPANDKPVMYNGFKMGEASLNIDTGIFSALVADDVFNLIHKKKVVVDYQLEPIPPETRTKEGVTKRIVALYLTDRI